MQRDRYRALNLTFRLFLTLPAIVVFLSTWGLLGNDRFPPFNDPANWLKIANAQLGNTYPMWEQTTLQYPPLFPALLAFLILLIGDKLFVVRLAGTLSLALLSISSYPMAKEVSGSSIVGLAAVWLTALHPFFFEMYGWGGYPNLLGLSLLMLALAFTLKTTRKGKVEGGLRNLALASVLSVLVILAHHLTTIIFLFLILALAILQFIRLISKDSSMIFDGDSGNDTIEEKSNRSFYQIFSSIFPFLSAIVALLLWRWAAGPFQFIVSNRASLLIRPFDTDALFWMFKDGLLLGFTFLSALFGAIALYRLKRRLALALLIAWVAFPLFFTQSYLLGIALDFKRFPSFSIPPLLILSASSILLFDGSLGISIKKIVKNSEEIVLELNLDLGRVALASILIATIGLNFISGISTQFSIFEYYHNVTNHSYGERERLDVLEWILYNTDPKAVVVADEYLGRWIEGYSMRRVLMTLPPHQSFLIGELERFQAADLILTSNIELRNRFIRLRDGAPYDGGQTPWIAVSDGVGYKNLVYLLDASSAVAFYFEGGFWIESPYRAKVKAIEWLHKGESEVSVRIIYETIRLIIEKTMRIDADEAKAIISYLVIPKDGAIISSMDLPVWIPYSSSIEEFRETPMGFLVNVDGNRILIETGEGFSKVCYGPDPIWGQKRIVFTFIPLENLLNATLIFFLPLAEENVWSPRIWASSSDELIEAYGVSHIALSKSAPEVWHVETDPRYRKVYENEKLVVYLVSKSEAMERFGERE